MDWEKILQEITFRTSRSSGAGGQHVNKTETRVEVILDVRLSEGLSAEEKDRVMVKLMTRINDRGELTLSSSVSRSQSSNKEDVTARLRSILEKAIVPERKRKKTKVPAEAVEQRLEEKKKRAGIKANRQKPDIQS